MLETEALDGDTDHHLQGAGVEFRTCQPSEQTQRQDKWREF